MLMGELLHFFLLPKPVKVQEEESEKKKQGISPDLPLPITLGWDSPREGNVAPLTGVKMSALSCSTQHFFCCCWGQHSFRRKNTTGKKAFHDTTFFK